MPIDDVIARLKAEKGNLRCKELVALLEGLGFRIRSGKTPSHKIVTHPSIVDARGNFSCGHGQNPTVLPNYVNNMRRMLEHHREQLTSKESPP